MEITFYLWLPLMYLAIDGWRLGYRYCFRRVTACWTTLFVSADTHLEYLPILGKSGTSLSHWSRWCLKVSVVSFFLFFSLGGILLNSLSTLLAGQLWILVLFFCLISLPSVFPGIYLDIILLLVPIQLDFRPIILCLIPSSCCPLYIMAYLSHLLSRLYRFRFFSLSW